VVVVVMVVSSMTPMVKDIIDLVWVPTQMLLGVCWLMSFLLGMAVAVVMLVSLTIPTVEDMSM